MRILIPCPDFEDSFADNVKVTLREMGHEVLGGKAMKASVYGSVAGQVLSVARERVFGYRPTPEEHRTLKLAKETRPDLLLSLTWDIHPEILEEMRTIFPSRRILWWGDAPANSGRWGIVNPGWDRVYVKDPDVAAKLVLVGLSASLLHEAMNPKWHRMICRQENSSVAIAGNYYAFRQAMIARLMRDGVTLALYGPKPPLWSLREVTRGWTGQYVTRGEKSRVFGAALACLNTFSPVERNSLNCRAFEIAGAGGLQLIEYRPVLDECFEPGKEVLAFSTYPELLDHIARARSHPEEMVSIRAAGARRALAHHTYRHRLLKILSDVGCG